MKMLGKMICSPYAVVKVLCKSICLIRYGREKFVPNYIRHYVSLVWIRTRSAAIIKSPVSTEILIDR